MRSVLSAPAVVCVSALLIAGCNAEYGITSSPDEVVLGELEPNVDTNGDGVPDLNIDIDGDGDPDLNIDLDEDGIPDLNIDLDGDGTADVNIDQNGDSVPDLNIDTDGDGLADTDLLDTFVVTEFSEVDIVFFGDTSGSMDEELAAIGGRIAEFTTRLENGGGNWQLISVNGDQGCATDTIFTPDTPDWANRFADAILEEPNNGDTDERGLVSVARAVERSAPGECNEGFVRPRALLHAIILSDENDESPGWATGNPDYWVPFIDRIVATKGYVQGLTKLSAITGPTPDGCAGSDPGFGYVEAMDGTGGSFLSICDPWEDQLDLLADASVVQDRFPLGVDADPATIFVTVNNFPSSDWWYDGVTNSVVFDPAPVEGSVVRVTYEAF